MISFSFQTLCKVCEVILVFKAHMNPKASKVLKVSEDHKVSEVNKVLKNPAVKELQRTFQQNKS